ncbi:hypothetical protein L228DRAFT_268741 [Xylona heveae TC161]|uniref:Ribosomal protein YmL11, mitochondrial n=1 Tax=Xylona heveae (strain CBS 132557 / TC161) TaxID=1328760 RepID=A0A165GJI5_XYLHT|nr:hypothetical protein L228DRAFT_268741 [Xylona heveae TC161]KZF22266.1 hypothetical protein L228DRAFT_268741 [Xylona heveae TC161]
MPPRIPLGLRQSAAVCPGAAARTPAAATIPAAALIHARHASAVTPAASHEQMTVSPPPIARYPTTQPPSHKPPEFRKSQLHRQYTSLLRSTPLMLLFQHNNVKASEWTGIRRELAAALRKADATIPEGSADADLASGIKFQIVQTGIFASALQVAEYFHPEQQQQSATSSSTTSAANIPNATPDPTDPAYTHALSRHAWEATQNNKLSHALTPLMSGPLAVLTFPNVSPVHLKAALEILWPSKPNFPAPTRRVNPGYHEPAVHSGLQKLLLLGARVEGKVFDEAGAKWVGTIGGGLDGLRNQLVYMLQGFGAGLTNTLESASKSLYFTIEGRRTMLEDEEKGGEKKDGEESA